MRLMLHIFRKDARRLWWVIAVSMAAVAVLAAIDSRRTDAVADSVESFLSLLAPAIWAFVAVLVIQGEGPVGDRQFWVTRPYPWAALLGAKALALVAFIHVPSFAADCAILAARGFNPLVYLPTLLAKQVTLAIAVTVPAAALAAVTRNLLQVVPAGAALLYAAVLLAGVVEFDATLAERLKSMELPDALDRDLIRGTIPNCTCKCGHKHVAVVPKSSKPSKRTRTNIAA